MNYLHTSRMSTNIQSLMMHCEHPLSSKLPRKDSDGCERHGLFGVGITGRIPQYLGNLRPSKRPVKTISRPPDTFQGHFTSRDTYTGRLSPHTQ